MATVLSASPGLVDVPAPPNDLPTEDGIPMESPWHRFAMNLLIELTHVHWHDRSDFYTGGNMFVYFSATQTRQYDYRGPDFFIVTDVDGQRPRDAWVVWEEDGRYPDLIIELLSPSTAQVDKTIKKTLYERTFHTAEYYCYDPSTQELFGWHLQQRNYVLQTPDTHGRLWSDVLQLWIGPWEGALLHGQAVWLRFFTSDGQLVPTEAEAERQRTETERQRTEAERQRAEAAEAELVRLRAQLAALEGGHAPEP